MLRRIAGFEFRYQFRNPVFWVAVIIFLLCSFAYAASTVFHIGNVGGNTHQNGPYSIALVQAILSVFYMFVTTAFVANVIVRDDDSGFGPIVRSTRITKFDYLFGRFLGAFLIAAFAFLVIPFGIWIGSAMPWVDAETVGPDRLIFYAWSYFALALPNILITSAIFFALATATRSMMTTYVGVIAFLILYSVVSGALRDQPDYRVLAAMVDPFGLSAFSETTRYWTAAERNSLVPDFSGLILWNRLLWISVSLAFLAAAHFLYRFSEKGISKRSRKAQKLEAQAESGTHSPATAASTSIPAPRFDGGTARAQFFARMRLEMRQVFRSPAFIVLMALGLFNAGVGLWESGELYGTPTFPITFIQIPILIETFAIIPIIVAIYYSGELVWRERDRKLNEIIDATPLPNWAFAIPKSIAVALVLLTMLLISAAGSILIQLIKGYTHLELGKYLLWYVLPIAWDVILISILAVFVQSLSPNKYVGWGVTFLYYIVGTITLKSMGFEHNLYLYAGRPDIPLSDMNGAGIYWIGAWWFRLYWGAVALILLAAAHLLWRRGTETRLRPRLRLARARLRGPAGLIAGLGLLLAVGTGAWIFYNTNILNDYRTNDDREEFLAEYEKRFLHFETLPQPTISHVVLNVALYPDRIRADVTGRYRLTNLTGRPINQVHVRNPERDLTLLTVDFPGARLAARDTEFDYRVYRLDRPMAPGESRDLAFGARREQVGFRNDRADQRLVPNGTFLNNFELAPAIGMSRSGLLQERTQRRKYGLSSELRPPRLEDLSATRRSYFGGGWSTADITVSTSADQVPIAPGRKVLDVTANGRRTARFVSDAPILTFFSIQSARYAERSRVHNGIRLSVYYDPAHAWNVDRMLNALEHGLDYYQSNFGPYQFNQARIIEFPGYERFAQAFANTMPYSEEIGFAADNSDPNTIDYVTYVTAHELGHQWWAHQVIGADMQGATMLSETLAQYSALMVMKHLYGEDKMRRFLQFELDRYLRGRGRDALEEMPLARVENQQYIHYNKASLVMYLLQQRLGEAAVNRALARFVARYRFHGAPYPRSLDLIRLFRAEATTPEQQALITDLFERITVYDFKAERPTAVRRADGRWDVTVTVNARKYYAGGHGDEHEAPLNDRIEVGLFTALPGHGSFDRSNVLMMERQPVHSGRQVFHFITAQRPTHAGVDPYNFYIDRNSNDNVAPVG